MSRRVILGACLLILVATVWGFRPLALAASQAGAGRATAATPCVGQPNSPECLIYRLDQIERRLDRIDASVGELQRRPVSGTSPGVSISHVSEGIADASPAYLQQRLDSMARVVNQLVDRANR
jgi:hypothetical protein